MQLIQFGEQWQFIHTQQELYSHASSSPLFYTEIVQYSRNEDLLYAAICFFYTEQSNGGITPQCDFI